MEAGMSDQQAGRRGDAFHLLVGGAVALVLGAGTAGAAIAIGPERPAIAAARPLSTAYGAVVTRAFGADDEDCVRISRRLTLPDGTVRIAHRVVCEE